ncbi:hypothetical protein CCACVL1_11082 [Corchorus capsularis]|uniref:Uncharacterized protein n=1 Tax=Corchorus capsularis TaxID=210143 RepID=A0A1R3IMW1_COCAP|nr:hypothetical protein CCACVL1_11082 [Corchorus capsularis]
MNSWCKAPLSSSSTLYPLPSSSSTPLTLLSFLSKSSSWNSVSFAFKNPTPSPLLLSSSTSPTKLVCKAAEYKFPDPIPEFAHSETDKFRTHLLKKLPKKDIYGDSVEQVVGICTEIFSTFLHSEYGGPGTLSVIPFIDMADTLNEWGLPGGPQAARAAVKWATDNVDKDWKEWTGSG